MADHWEYDHAPGSIWATQVGLSGVIRGSRDSRMEGCTWEEWEVNAMGCAVKNYQIIKHYVGGRGKKLILPSKINSTLE